MVEKWLGARVVVVLSLLTVVLISACGKNEEGARHTADRSVTSQTGYTSTATAVSAQALEPVHVKAVVDAYRTALTKPDSDNIATTKLVAVHLSLAALKDRALMSENPLIGLIYAETLLGRADDDVTRSYARLRIAQHAAALYDYDRAAQELHQIADDKTTVASENRMYEKYLSLSEVYAEMGNYEAARAYACKALNDPVRHPQNARLRLSLLLCAATCAAYLDDSQSAQSYLTELAGATTSDTIVLLTINNAKRDLDNLDQFYEAAHDTRKRTAERRAHYASMTSRAYDDIVCEREAVIGRPLTAVERVQLLNCIKSASPQYNP